MSGALRHAWKYFGTELWWPLADLSGDKAAAPASLFSDLFTNADEFLSPRPTDSELQEAHNNPQRARERFLALTGTDFASEFEIVLFIEQMHSVFSDYEIPGFVQLYVRLLSDAIQKFNLRYRLDEPFRLRFLLPGSFTNLYSELQHINSRNSHLSSLLADFEKTFDRYARTQDPTDLRNCIHMASNYVEGLASVSAGIPAVGNTLGRLVGSLTDWPHAKVRESLVNLYHFCSDYPGIRHPGTPAHALRALGTRDATLASLLLLSFSGYLTLHDERAVLGI